MQASHVDLLRQIRVSRDADDLVISKEGRTGNMGLGGAGGEGQEGGEDWTAPAPIKEAEEEDMALEI